MFELLHQPPPRFRGGTRRSSLESLRVLVEDDEAADLALLNVDRQLVGLGGDVLEFLDAGERLRLVVANDLGDHITFFDPRGLGGAAVLDGGDDQALHVRRQSERLGQFGGQRLDFEAEVVDRRLLGFAGFRLRAA